MAGHSKWANIKHRKAKQDSIRAKIFTKIGKELMVAVKHGGPDPEVNGKLKAVIQKARDNNIPLENIQRHIDKASGNLEGVNYEEFTYEGYGPGGVAVLLELMTDNRNRTAADVRHLFSKYGGNLGEVGCVAWSFDRKGIIHVEDMPSGADEDETLLIALEAGAEDINFSQENIQVVTAPEKLQEVRENLEEQGLKVTLAEINMIPQTMVELAGDDAKRMLKLLDALEDHDDVQNVYSNFDVNEETLAELSK